MVGPSPGEHMDALIGVDEADLWSQIRVHHLQKNNYALNYNTARSISKYAIQTSRILNDKLQTQRLHLGFATTPTCRV